MFHYMLFEHFQRHKVAVVNLEDELKCISNKSIEIVKDLSLKLKNVKEIVENTIIIKPIIIDVDIRGSYDLLNGLVDANRDIVMKLLKILKNSLKIKNIIGMCEIFYIWSKQPIFRWVRFNWILDQVMMWLGDSKKLKLLYKATTDGFAARIFHEKCDKKGATVTIITSSEGWVFGGYAAVPWENRNGCIRDDLQKSSFLFTLVNPRNTPPEKFRHESGLYAINSVANFGPTFVWPDAIRCSNNSNTNNKSFTNLGGNYENTTGVSGEVVFTGKRRFTSKEIEVYSVV